MTFQLFLKNELLVLKIQDKGNEACFFINEPASFILLKTDFFTIFERTLLILLRVFSNFTVSAEAYLVHPPNKKGRSF